jgi:hypothetical protein
LEAEHHSPSGSVAGPLTVASGHRSEGAFPGAATLSQ